jgi:hypothetical protein
LLQFEIVVAVIVVIRVAIVVCLYLGNNESYNNNVVEFVSVRRDCTLPATIFWVTGCTCFAAEEIYCCAGECESLRRKSNNAGQKKIYAG